MLTVKACLPVRAKNIIHLHVYVLPHDAVYVDCLSGNLIHEATPYQLHVGSGQQMFQFLFATVKRLPR